MKKCLSVILAVILMLAGTVGAFAETRLNGDVNGDGKVTSVDARRVLLVVAGIVTVTDTEKANFDVDGDAKLTSVDAREILQIAAGLKPVVSVPEEKPEEETTEEKMASAVRTEFLRLVNEERAKRGVNPLTVNDILCGGATVRAYECIEKFSHTRPNGKSFEDVLQGEYEYSYSSVGENIAYIWDYTDSYDLEKIYDDADLKELAKTFFTMFKNSSVHYNNMTKSQYEETGFGVAFHIDKSKGTITVSCSHLFGTPA